MIFKWVSKSEICEKLWPKSWNMNLDALYIGDYANYALHCTTILYLLKQGALKLMTVVILPQFQQGLKKV